MDWRRGRRGAAAAAAAAGGRRRDQITGPRSFNHAGLVVPSSAGLEASESPFGDGGRCRLLIRRRANRIERFAPTETNPASRRMHPSPVSYLIVSQSCTRVLARYRLFSPLTNFQRSCSVFVIRASPRDPGVRRVWEGQFRTCIPCIQ